MSAARRTRATLAGLAAGGVMAGHWVAYAVREPDAGARAVLLEATGHHLLPQLSVLAALATLVALLAAPRRGRGPAVSYARAARPLVALQVAGFAALELAERLAAHGHELTPAHLLDPAVGVGVAAQIVIGCAAAALIVALHRLAPRARPARLAGHIAFLTPAGAPAPARTERPGDGARTLRGPPVLSRA